MMKKYLMVTLVAAAVISAPTALRAQIETSLLPDFRYLSEVAPNSLDYGQEVGEWLEIYNPNNDWLDISNLMMKDNNTPYIGFTDFSDSPFVEGMEIPPRGYAIVMDMKIDGDIVEGDTYYTIVNNINEYGNPSKVIFLTTVDDAIGDGLNDFNDQLVIYGQATLRNSGSSILIHEELHWHTAVGEYQSYQYGGGDHWYTDYWTPARRYFPLQDDGDFEGVKGDLRLSTPSFPPLRKIRIK